MTQEINSNPPKHYVTVKAAIWDGDKLFLQREKRASGRIVWGFPGGRIEGGEHPRDGLKREVMEEISAPITWMSDLPVKVWSTIGNKDNVVGILYEAKADLSDLKLVQAYDEEIQEARYVSLDEVKSDDWDSIHKPFMIEYMESHLSSRPNGMSGEISA